MGLKEELPLGLTLSVGIRVGVESVSLVSTVSSADADTRAARLARHSLCLGGLDLLRGYDLVSRLQARGHGGASPCPAEAQS
jgi:hypothetical protein